MLVNTATLDKELIYVPLDDLPPDEELESAPPKKSFVMDIYQNGVHTPITLVRKEDGYDVVFGIRRIKGARRAKAMAAPEIEDIYEEIPAWVYEEMPEEQRLILSMSENAQRSPNHISDVKSIRELLRRGWSYEKIAIHINQPKSRVIRLDRRYGTLEDEFVDAMIEGRIAPGVTASIAKQNKGIRQKLLQQLEKNGRLIGRDIKEAKQVEREKILEHMQLPNMEVPEAATLYCARAAGGLLGPFRSAKEALKHGRPYRLVEVA